MEEREQRSIASSQERIRALNDRLRTTGEGGRTLATRSMQALPPDIFARAVVAICEFDDFTPGNDPHGEHDFGQVTIDGEAVFWKIDYYDVNMEFGSPDPADDTITCRVLTIMLASDL